MDTGERELRRLVEFPGYWITSDGRVFSGIEQVRRTLGRGFDVIVHDYPVREIHPTQTGRYLMTGFYRDGKMQIRRIHVLVLTTFAGPRPFPKAVSRHLNGNSTDNRIENLTWGTQKENIQDKIAAGTIAKGRKHGMAKITEEIVREIRNGPRHRGWGMECVRRFGLSQSQVSRILNNESWRDVE